MARAMAGNSTGADEIYQKLRVAFPYVHVTRESVQSTPELSRLLLSLAEHVDNTGTTRSVAAELESERRQLSDRLRGYLASRLLHSLLEDLAVRPPDDARLADDKLRDAVSECLSLAELRDALPLCPPGSDSEPAAEDGGGLLLGLSAARLAPSAEQRQTLARLPRALDLRLARLADRCAAAVSTAASPAASPAAGAGAGQGCSEDESQESAVVRLVRLPGRLEELLRQGDDSRARLTELAHRRRQQMVTQSRLMAHQLDCLLKLINKYKLEHKVDLERKTIDYLTFNIQGMLLKIRLLTLQIQCETYTEECLAALRAAARHLSAETERSEARLAAGRRQLDAYRTAGETFTELARQYRALRQKADQRRWLIAEMDTLGGGAAAGQESN